ncbi:MAG: DUF4337 domain-containing protein, partial [Bacteroidia bacterium]|nr:DUF4337 domain-containing protein [Bacteroidia bacterium]
MSESEEKDPKQEAKEKFDMIIGLMVAIFGAVLAVASIGGGKYGGDEIIASNQANKAYAWYQSKSIKNTSLEAQHDLLLALKQSNAIKESHNAGVDSFILGLEKKTKRYKKEMREILEGSSKIDSSEWIQDKDGKLGQIIGAKEWEAKADALNVVGDWFDYCTLFLNMCLVFGAICFVIQVENIRKIFFVAMNIVGIIGTALCI